MEYLLAAVKHTTRDQCLLAHRHVLASDPESAGHATLGVLYLWYPASLGQLHSFVCVGTSYRAQYGL